MHAYQFLFINRGPLSRTDGLAAKSFARRGRNGQTEYELQTLEPATRFNSKQPDDLPLFQRNPSSSPNGASMILKPVFEPRLGALQLLIKNTVSAIQQVYLLPTRFPELGFDTN